MKKRSDFFVDNLTNKTLDGPFVDELGTTSGPWPRYLVITSTDGGKTLSKLSPFAIHKGVKGIAGGEVTIERQFSVDIYLTCSKKSQKDNLLKCVFVWWHCPCCGLLLLVVSLHHSDPLSDTFFCDIVVNHEIIKRACLSQQQALEEMLHRLISFFTITRGVILICIFPLS